jgi:hypothetical protein
MSKSYSLPTEPEGVIPSPSGTLAKLEALGTKSEQKPKEDI